MNSPKRTIFILLSIAIIGCASNPKPEYSKEQVERLDQIVSNNSFAITARWAWPLATGSLGNLANAGLLPWGSTASMIDISGSNNYLHILKDSVVAKLPYYGERQMGGTYGNTNNGIQFDGAPKNFRMTKNDDGKGYKLDFLINNNMETYDVNVNLYPNLQSRINITSSHRTTISYKGEISDFSSN
ncbi:hypothetical protein HME9304_03181 [Flagellimonas maritima]|uniref:DUF4251 domain-containing protein n=1 Tax=Flagellimonas maritima TaxID=1383885 RepID=A0A2Z4LWM3_9FLAO|nr:DUF4251 domain-containing protein [Allomuricauda aurantiaca]AWX46149.1 hypothetical protein HME9304_03181 [Allomuricauda aurantiaca]